MNKEIKLWWWHDDKNAGDYFTKWIFEKLNYNVILSKEPELVGCGSVLAAPEVNNCAIWGCGFQNENQNIKNKNVNILAVRGFLTLNTIKKRNIITGDPGILASHFYKVSGKKIYKFGIIPHYAEQFFYKDFTSDNIKIINIKTDDIDTLLKDITECEFILSSSLHGIIFAHSFGIPALHIKHIELDCAKEYKFEDYYSNFNLKYLRKSVRTFADLNPNELNVLYDCKSLFTPSQTEILTMQQNLLNILPYK